MHVAIVGKGPSLANLNHSHICQQVVITLNQAILAVRDTNPCYSVYSMQKDGCVPHAGTDFVYNLEPHDCAPDSAMVPTLPGERLILSERESKNCLLSSWYERPREHTFRISPDPWWRMSILCAVDFALEELDATRITFVSFDSYTRDDYRTWYPEGPHDDGPQSQGYLVGAMEAARLCATRGVAMQWITPE